MAWLDSTAAVERAYSDRAGFSYHHQQGDQIVPPPRATFLPVYPLARRDVPSVGTKAFQFSLPLSTGVAKGALDCTH